MTARPLEVTEVVEAIVGGVADVLDEAEMASAAVALGDDVWDLGDEVADFVRWRLVADRRDRAAARSRRLALVGAVAMAVAIGAATLPGQALSWLVAGVALAILGHEVAWAVVSGHRAGVARLRAANGRSAVTCPLAAHGPDRADRAGQRADRATDRADRRADQADGRRTA